MVPQTEDDLAGMIRDAQGQIAIRGGGTRTIGRDATGAALSTAGLEGITLYEPGALTLVVRAGTPLATVTAALVSEGQRLPFEPPDLRGLLGTAGVSTIGGVVAANASGPRRVQAGACRDSLIGVRYVDGAGNIVKNGGRVMKNVTGYDLVKLMAGSHGTLGVLSEVSFKLLPEPETAATIALHGLDVAGAVSAMAAALGSPFEVTAAAHVPDQGTFLRIEGFAASVAYRAGRLQALMSRRGAGIEVIADVGKVRDLWRAIRDVDALAPVPGDLWRLSVKPSDAPGIVARMPEDRRVVLDWGGGLIWAVVAPGTDLRSQVAPFAGHATLMRADPDTRARIAVFHPEPAPVARLTAALRQKFDPRGILNSGIMG